MPMTLAQLAEHARRSGYESIALAGPVIRYRSLNTSEYDPCLDWCAQLWMTVEELDGYELCCGCLDFLTIRLGRELIADNILDSYSQTAVEFAPLFDGLWLDEAVQEQFDATLINDVVVVLDAQLALPLRGRQLGAWMLSEVAGRMLSSHDGLVVARPIPDDTDPNTHAGRMATERLTQHWRSCGLVPVTGHQLGAWMLSEVAGRMLSSHDGLVVARPIPDDTDPNTHAGRMATERLTQHWRSCGLVPVTGHQEFLAQASAYTALGSARAALDRIADRDITLTADQMARWTEPFGSHD